MEALTPGSAGDLAPLGELIVESRSGTRAPAGPSSVPAPAGPDAAGSAAPAAPGPSI